MMHFRIITESYIISALQVYHYKCIKSVLLLYYRRIINVLQAY